MSSPLDRSFRMGGISPYAPKWARDLDSVPKKRPEEPQHDLAGDDGMVANAPADVANFESGHLRPPGSLAPSLVPEPPMQESWLRGDLRSLARDGGGIGALFPYLFAIFLAALMAFVFVVELPNILSFVSKQRSAADSFGARFEGDAPRRLPGAQIAASEPKLAGAAHSDSAPARTDRRPAAINPAVANTPVVRVSTDKPTEPAIAAPASEHPPTANSLPASSAPTVVAPPVANVEPDAAPVHVTSAETVPLQPEKRVRPLGTDEIETLLKQGKDFVSVGDFASARMVFERVADAHDARGAIALAASYDPIVLAKIGAKGANPDVAKAREWYIKARDLGSPDAAPRLEVLANSKR